MVIREAVPEDAEKLIEYMKTVGGESKMWHVKKRKLSEMPH